MAVCLAELHHFIEMMTWLRCLTTINFVCFFAIVQNGAHSSSNVHRSHADQCRAYAIKLQTVGKAALLNSSFHTVIDHATDQKKHLLGVYLMQRALDNRCDPREEVLSLFDYTLPGDYRQSHPYSPDELHGGVWHAIMSLAPHSRAAFWNTAQILCWHPALSYLLFIECFHAVGHGATLQTLYYNDSYVTLPCPSLAPLSVRGQSFFEDAAVTCAYSSERLMKLWCLDGVYHSQRLYRRVFPTTDCIRSMDPWLCLRNNPLASKWLLRANIAMDIVPLAGATRHAFFDWYYHYYFHNRQSSTFVISTCKLMVTRFLQGDDNASLLACLVGGLRQDTITRPKAICAAVLNISLTLPMCSNTTDMVMTALSVSATEAIRKNMEIHPYRYRHQDGRVL